MYCFYVYILILIYTFDCFYNCFGEKVVSNIVISKRYTCRVPSSSYGKILRLLDLGMTWMMTRSFKLDADVWTMEADRVLKIDFFFV
ncbi:hypothetical protein HanPI659440_Chr09g0325071 [Helianthus annuus]|nr:hypothetical protein HanOQP8_Chr09g0314101 [Helianthus annuus]KAJ0752501.1 hypothetical protein HanPI659440_Chr09g0325071 [Helianthus annuus]